MTWVDDCGCRAKSITLGESRRLVGPGPCYISPRREPRGRPEIYTYLRDVCLWPLRCGVRRFLACTGCSRRTRPSSLRGSGAIQSADPYFPLVAESTIASCFVSCFLLVSDTGFHCFVKSHFAILMMISRGVRKRRLLFGYFSDNFLARCARMFASHYEKSVSPIFRREMSLLFNLDKWRVPGRMC